MSGVLAVRKRYAEDAADHLAASITYFGFLSLFPLLLLGLSAIGFVVGGDPALVQEWTQRLSAAIPGLAPLIRDSLAKVAENRGAAGVVGFAGLIWSASRASEAAGYALARIYRRTPIQGFLRKAIWSLGNTIALGLLALAGLVLAAGAGGYRAGGPAGIALRGGAALLAFGIDFALFAAGYRLLTRGTGPRIEGIWRGALFGAVGWIVLKVAGSWYAVRTATGAGAVYGAFASVVGVLLLLYLASRLFLYGAEWNALALERARAAAHG